MTMMTAKMEAVWLRRSETPIRAPSTQGLVHPMMCPAYGWIPYVIATRIEMRPTPKVRFPHQSIVPW